MICQIFAVLLIAESGEREKRDRNVLVHLQMVVNNICNSLGIGS